MAPLILLPGRKLYSDVVLSDSPVGYWKLSDPNGTQITDYSGNALHGSEAGSGMLFQQPTVVNNNGPDTSVEMTATVGNYINIPNVAQLKPTTAVSIEYWIEPDAGNVGLGGVGDNNPPNCWGYWVVYGITSQRFRFFLGTDVGPNGNSYGQAYIGDQGVYPQNNRYHVIATYTSGARILYVNGAVEDSDTKTGNIQYIGGSINAVIGGEFGAGSIQRFYDGHMDDVAIYNYVLTPSQVLAHYNAGI